MLLPDGLISFSNFNLAGRWTTFFGNLPPLAPAVEIEKKRNGHHVVNLLGVGVGLCEIFSLFFSLPYLSEIMVAARLSVYGLSFENLRVL